MATLSIKIDDDIKKEAEAEFKAMGLSTSAAVNIYFRKVIQEHGIPFVMGSSRNFRIYDSQLLPKSIERVKLKTNKETGVWQIPSSASNDAKEWLNYD